MNARRHDGGPAVRCKHPGYAGDDVERCVCCGRTLEQIATDYNLANQVEIVIMDIAVRRPRLLELFDW